MISLVASSIGSITPFFILPLVIVILCHSKDVMVHPRKLLSRPESKTCDDSSECNEKRKKKKSSKLSGRRKQYEKSSKTSTSKSEAQSITPVRQVDSNPENIGTETNEVNEENEKAISAREYEDEIIDAAQSPKDPEYDEVTYIMGPFSEYGSWHRGAAKSKRNLQRKKVVDGEVGTEALHVEDQENNNIAQKCHQKSNRSRAKNRENHRVSINTTGIVRGIPRDQTKPHKLRKDRQEFNPYRRIWVQAKIKQIGGHIIDRESRKFVYYPSTQKEEFVKEHQQSLTPVAVVA